MLVGHTKFAPDWCFGLFKQRYRRTFVSSLEDVAIAVNSSADVNVAQLVGTQNGEILVPMYNWATYFQGHFRPIPQLKSYHHFKFSADHPHQVILQEFSDTPGSSFCLLADSQWQPNASDVPTVITPAGLSHGRKTYLYKQIREFCRPGTEDITCPKPAILYGEKSPSPSGEDEEGTLEAPIVPPAPKSTRRCGQCGGVGHTRRTCKNH